jgi:hypothetical protein
MPIIKARLHRIKSVRHTAKIEEANRDALVVYAHFIEDTADYVLDRLIEGTIAKDREFVAWRIAHPEITYDSLKPRTRFRTKRAHDEGARRP